MILGLDYGERRIGVAVTDPDQQHALAHGVVQAQPEEEALHHLRRLLVEEGAERVVVGLPLTLAGGEGPQAEAVRRFGARLAAAVGLPVEFIDERFTTAEAEVIAATKGTAPDAEAARLILEAWLARRR